MKETTRMKLKQFFCGHAYKEIRYYRGDYWGEEEAIVQIMGGNAFKWEKCVKCGKEWGSEGWFLPTSIADKLESKPGDLNE